MIYIIYFAFIYLLCAMCDAFVTLHGYSKLVGQSYFYEMNPLINHFMIHDMDYMILIIMGIIPMIICLIAILYYMNSDVLQENYKTVYLLLGTFIVCWCALFICIHMTGVIRWLTSGLL